MNTEGTTFVSKFQATRNIEIMNSTTSIIVKSSLKISKI